MNYKGMDKDMKCRGFQYEIGKEYETDKAEVCECGFHACEYPLDVFNYYPPAGSRFFEVEQGGEIRKSAGDSKVASTKIKIGAELNIASLVKAAIEYTKERCTQGEGDCATGDSSVAMASGVDGKVMGAIGCALFLVERGEWNGSTFPIVSAKAEIVDGKKIRPNVWYTLKNGEFVEWEED